MTIELTDKQQLIGFLKSHGLYTKHSLGQNFLIDHQALAKIIAAADLKSDDCVVEVGPGTGVLTNELVKVAKKVIAIELDAKLADLLRENHTEKNLRIINQDILKVNIPELVDDKSYKVVANIPYYITAKILKLFLTLKSKPEIIVLLVQKEVAERICAKAGQMSILALSVQAYGDPEIISIVKKESFFPSPEVDSAILRIRIRNSNIEARNTKQIQNSNLENSKIISDFDIWISDLANEKEFFRLIHVGFASKRKTLVNNLSAGLRIDKKAATDIIKSIGLSENVRAQELGIDQWIALIRELGIRN